MGLAKKLATATEIFRRDGWRGITKRLAETKRVKQAKRRERIWLERHGVLTDAQRAGLVAEIASLERRPLISILLPVYNIDEIWLRKCIESVIAQLYPNWQLCIADDHSTQEYIPRVLKEFQDRDARINVVYRDVNGHISAASNSALEIADGEFCVLLDHDDELSEDALLWVAKEILEHSDVAMIYSDEDMIDDRGRRYSPKFKPDFSLDLLYSLNLVTHLSAYRTDILREIGGFRIGTEGSQDYDLALRFIEKIDASRIRHIPRILYHWRSIPGSVAYGSHEKPYAHERAREAIRSHFERTGVDAVVEQATHNLHRVRYRIPEPNPSVTVLLVAHHPQVSSEAVDGWESVTNYSEARFVLVQPNDNVARSLNDAAASVESDLLVFADCDLAPESSDWLTELINFAVQPQIGAVGGRIISVDDRVVGGGYVLGGASLAHIAHGDNSRDEWGNLSRNQFISNFSAVSSRCLAIRSDVFSRASGFAADELPSALYDVDLCLRLGEMDMRVVLLPHVVLREVAKHSEPRATNSEREYLRERWQAVIENDPFSNPAFVRESGNFDLRI